MNIQKTVSGTTLTVALEGRLDTTTAPKLEEELRGSVDGAMLLRNVNEAVMEVFEVTGFSDILRIE